MTRISVSVPGKIHLMGEHAVVYGKPALLAAINKRLTVTFEETEKALEFKTEESDSAYIRHAVELVCQNLNKPIPQGLLTVTSEIPIGYHIGSSAAVAVGVVGALYYFFTKKWDLEKINALAYEVEKKMHGNPSGGDNTTVTYGGFILYQKKSETEKVFEKIPLSLPKNLHHFYLIDTGRPKENTGEMVALVKSKVNPPAAGQMSKMKTLFDENEIQTKWLVTALYEADEKALIDAIQKGEQTLEGMGVVSEKVKPLIRDIEKAGGVAKILGGGGVTEGVGFLLCYHKNRNIVEQIISNFHYSMQPITLGEEGVKLETITN